MDHQRFVEVPHVKRVQVGVFVSTHEVVRLARIPSHATGSCTKHDLGQQSMIGRGAV